MSTIEVRDEGHVRWIGLNRPDKRNAIDQAMAEDFAAALEDARRQPCVLIVHSTTPGIFAAGADIAELRDFGQPELSLGILAGAGANWRLAQLAGLGTARRMLYAGARLSAEEALRAGLVDEVAADVTAAGRDLAATIAKRSWRALELTKLALRSQRQATTTFDLAAQALLFGTEDKYERMTAFLERKPR
jgi:enoyl-CoA hydratase